MNQPASIAVQLNGARGVIDAKVHTPSGVVEECYVSELDSGEKLCVATTSFAKWEVGKPLNPSKEAKAAVAIQHWALHVPPVRRHKEKHDQHGIWETFPGSLVKGLAKQKQDSFGEPLPK